LRTNVAILKATGRLDDSFNAGSVEGPQYQKIYYAGAETIGRVVVAGTFTSIAGQPRNGLARLLPNGGLDTSYTRGLSNWFTVQVAQLLPDDSLAVCGYANPPAGSSFSFVARLAGGVMQGNVPQITQNAVGTRLRQGQDTLLSITAASATPLSYQWYLNGQAVPGATSASFQIRNIQASQAGLYFPILANRSGTVTGNVAIVTVDDTPLGPAGGDNSFQPGDGADGEVMAMAVQSDGKIVLGGSFRNFDRIPRAGIARLKPNGRLDSEFSPKGTGGTIRALLIQPDGKIIAGGDFSQFNDAVHPNLVRLNADGSVDSEFRIGNGPSSTVHTLARQPDGQILLGGAFETVSGVASARVARLRSDGTVDPAFSALAGVNGTVSAIAVQKDGRILVGGLFSMIGGPNTGVTRVCLARLLSDGSPDWDFNPGWGVGPALGNPSFIYDRVRAIVPLDNGEILVGGRLSRANDERRLGIVKLSAAGEVMPSFFASVGRTFFGRSPSAEPVSSIVVRPDGCILVGLQVSTMINGASRSLIACLNPDGSLNPAYPPDLSWGGGSTGATYANALALLPDGSVLVAGKIDLADGLPRNGIARYAQPPVAHRKAPEFGVDVSNIALPAMEVVYDPGLNGASVQVGQDVILSVPVLSFEQVHYQWEIGGVAAPGATNPVYRLNNVRSWDGEPIRLLVRNSVGSAASSDITLKVSVPRPEAGSVDTSFAPPAPINGKVKTLIRQSDGKVILGGSFVSLGGVWSPLVARLNPDGSLDSFNPGWSTTTGMVSAVVVQRDGRILCGGDFAVQHPSDGRVDSKLVRLLADGSRDLQFKPQLDAAGWVMAIAARDDGSVAIGGSFNEINQAPQQNVALLQADGTIAPGFLATVNGRVQQLVWQPDGKLLVGGAFTEVNGVGQRSIARLNSDGTLDTTFDPNGGAHGEVDAIALQTDGRIVLGGQFSVIGLNWAPGLARLNSNGTVDESFTPDVDSTAINDLVLQPDGKIIITGDLTAVDGLSERGVARLNSDGSLALISIRTPNLPSRNQSAQERNSPCSRTALS
jgi:uncharacterized delta-60 repeat protein